MPIVSRNPATAGDGGGVQVVTVPVSSAQILDLHNTPVTLVAGVGGEAITLVAVTIVYLAGLVPYLDGGGFLQVNPNAWSGLSSAGFWDSAVNVIAAPPISGPSSSLASLYDGIDLTLFQDTASPTLGDGTLLVTLSYFLAPVV